MANTIIYKDKYEANLQKNLAEPTYFEALARTEYTSDKVLHNPYKNRSAAVSYTKGGQYSFADVTVTDDTVDIDTTQVVTEFIDEADLGIAGYDFQMELSDDQSRAIREAVEGEFLKAHSQGTTFDDGDIGGTGGTDITLSATNVDNVVRAARKKLMQGRGFEMYNRFGASFIWDPAQFELLSEYAMGQGYSFADGVLATGRVLEFGGFRHYESNLLETETSTTHALAFVNNAIHVGIYNGNYGKVKVLDQDPNMQAGVGFRSRVDMKVKVWNNMAPLVLDVNCVEIT